MACWCCRINGERYVWARAADISICVEIDVEQIVEGDLAVSTVDAFSDIQIEGIVESIAPKATEGSGVNYTVILEMTEVPEQLRWGMTAFVDIELE